MKTEEYRAPLIDHIRELRTRLMWSLLFIVGGAAIGYAIKDQLLDIIRRPLHQTLYYTDPTGALSFVIKICLVFGMIIGLPMVMYQLFSFLGPLLARRTRKMTVLFTGVSVLLAVGGVLFAYFITLPAALKFLVSFSSSDIQSLITANEYFNFAFAYITGFALLFQIPLVLLFLDWFKPMPPKKLLGSIRYVIVISFVAAAIITPTPDPINQTLMAAPAVLLYVCSVILILILHARRKTKSYSKPATVPVQASRSNAPKPTYAKPLGTAPARTATHTRTRKSMDFITPVKPATKNRTPGVRTSISSPQRNRFVS